MNRKKKIQPQKAKAFSNSFYQEKLSIVNLPHNIMPLMNTYSRFNLSFQKGEGVYLFDENNNKYLDLMSGIGVNSLGYQHPKILEAFNTALQKPTHLSNLYEIPQQNKLAKTLIKDSPFDKFFFCNSGTEANEGAIKLVRKFYNTQNNLEKNIIVSFNHSFHGRTMGSLTITGKESIKTGFTPLIGNTKILNWNDSEELETYIKNNHAKIAGIFMEPIQGEGGINLPNKNFIQTIKNIHKKYDILLVIDEVQTGIGRTGKKYAFEHFDISPDIITLAKGMGGGVPIGAIGATEKVAKAFTPSTHGTTFGGNPLVCEVANAVCEEVLKNNFLENVKNIGDFFTQKIENLVQKFPQILLEKKGLGLMIGIEINSIENRNFLMIELMKNKFLVLPSGDKTLRFLPPLIITEKETEEFWNIFQNILTNI